MTDLPQSSGNSIQFHLPKSPKIDVALSALLRIRELAATSTNKETGGILVGFNAGKDIRVTAASDAGPNAERSGAHFLRDTEHCREFLQQNYSEFGADYVGEWHTHVINLRGLSAGDIGTLASIFIDPDYNFESFVVILVVSTDDTLELQVYVAERDAFESRRLVLSRLYRGPLPETTPPDHHDEATTQVTGRHPEG